MKILIISPKMPYPPKDGGALATLNIAAGLAQTGNMITLLCLNTRKHYTPEEEIPDELRHLIRFVMVKHDTGLNFFRMLVNFVFSPYPYIAERFKSDRLKQELRKLLTSDKYDIVQLEGPYLAWYIPLIRSFTDAKISLRAHNIESEIWETQVKGKAQFIQKFYLADLSARIRVFEKDTLQKIDLLVPVTEKVNTFFYGMEKQAPSHVSGAGLFIDDYPFSATKNVESLFFIGSLDWLPNQEGLLWFLDEVWNSYQNKIPFHIAGRRPPDFIKRKLIKTPGVVYHGEVEDAREFIDKYDVMICPLNSGSGIRVKILEAMLMGKIVVATPMSLEGISAVNGEHVLHADSAMTFNHIINELINNPVKFADMGAKARNLITENFNNFVLCKKLTGFYWNNSK